MDKPKIKDKVLFFWNLEGESDIGKTNGHYPYEAEIVEISSEDDEYYYSNKNLGLSRAINLLIKKTKTKYCMVTEPDITIDKKSIIKLKKIILKKRDLILVGPSYKKIKKNNEYEIRKRFDGRIRGSF